MTSELYRQIKSDFSALVEIFDQAIRDLDTGSLAATNGEIEHLVRAKEAAERGASLVNKHSGSTPT